MTSLTVGLEAALGAQDRLQSQWLRGGQLMTAPATYVYSPPALGGATATAPDVDSDGAMEAAAAAAAAQRVWAETPPMERARVVRQIAGEIEANRVTLAEAIVLDSGKTIGHARAEVDFCLRVLETLLASVAELGAPARTDFLTGRRVMTMLRPVGPALLMTPWNFPLNLGVRKLATALLAGCTAVWKPSDRAPVAASVVAEAITRTDLPAGVISVVPTSDSIGVVDALLGSGLIRKLSFTGSTAVGKQLMKQAADQLLRTSFELGGNGPAIVAESVDVDAAADAIVKAKFASNGQVCTTINRLYVSRHRAEELASALRARMDQLHVGWPQTAGTDVGPVISSQSAERLNGLIVRAEAGGANVTVHGNPPPAGGTFVRPTLVWGVSTDDDICQQELFGPVLPVVIYDDLDDAIAQANATPYGLSSYIFGDRAVDVEHMLSGMRSGLVAVNGSSPSSVSTPFGGVGWSGVGRENGVRGLLEFLDETSYVY